jgi:nucleotide-binding universal stress UspA family protein
MAAVETPEQVSVAPERSPFERILVPIDFTWAAREAFILAMRLSSQWNSAVVLFYAPGSDGNDEFLDYTGVPWDRDDVIGEAHGYLSRFAETVVPGSTQRVVIDALPADDPVRAVADACERHDPTLLVLGTHARDRRRWSRSRAERIAREVSCTVMMIPAPREPRVDADS